jgi:hypothetical protein
MKQTQPIIYYRKRQTLPSSFAIRASFGIRISPFVIQ